MATTVGLLVADLKEGIDKEDAVLKKLREGMAKGGLIERQSYGFSVEHPQRLYWTLYFENGFERKDFKWPEAEYGNFVDDLKWITTADYTRYYFDFPSFPHAIIAAPVTEIAIGTLKADADLAAFKPVMEAAGAKPVVVLLIGWDSIEAHKSVSAIPENQAKVVPLHAFAEKVDIVHVSFIDKV
ncbi:uncharacterized protein B0H18DRAFT_1115848 [Fomitopsis serialis]|uniref:uncharacterized protein n=1 Tax=Fomitopsis serialis TaxID=139415 RepID=UPI0020083889|nr:uncharacterized protein B0H18DRAFT_1115848 [Neoantrodia serialis]KAH9932620.1 hypothetical protein B0H18DRAFT_1115848 [Neoantrodia serialis]